MLPGKSQSPFEDIEDLVYAIIAIVFLLCILFSTACTSAPSKEPAWQPHGYIFSEDDPTCAWINEDADIVPCADKKLHDFLLLPLDELITLKAKLQKVKEW